ncbi:hypothetical protein LCGC14_1890110 [marine sediment metagenome]|uniref:Uncharacterized protein n=1 Tax=marine sediment metagenome TaxID=412755 RepID=A0A0F9IXZ1_9ZZZZ
MRTRYIVKIFQGSADLVAMRKTKKEAKALLAEHGRTAPRGGSITPIEPGAPWYNGVC